MTATNELEAIESPLYIRQRKALLAMSVVITVINLIGGELKTNLDGNSTFILPFGVTFDIARPWLINWLLLTAMAYLLIRYFIFSREVANELNTRRKMLYKKYVEFIDASLRGYVEPEGVGVDVKNCLWFWKYDASNYNDGIYEKFRHDVSLPAKKTFLPTLKVELELFLTTHTYSDYYSPYLMVGAALLSNFWRI